MTFRGDERGAAIQIGAVILFAFIVIAMASYQATVVPSQNSGVEFNHNQDVQSQMVDLTNGIDASARDGTRGSHAVRLGTTYPSRTLFVNPGSPSGQLRTVGSGNITFSGVEVAESEPNNTAEYWDTDPEIGTSRLQYEPNYNEYRNAPTTVFEHGELINDNPRGSPTTLASGDLVEDGELSVFALQGDVQASSSSAVSVNRRALSTAKNTIELEGGTIALPVADTAYWTEWEEDTEVEEIDISVDESNNLVELEITEPVELNMAEVGLGSVSRESPNERAAYLYEVNSATVEVRDRFNNPVNGATVDINGGSEQTGTNGQVSVGADRTGDDIEWSIDGSEDDEKTLGPTTVDAEDVGAVGGGGGGSSSAYDVEWFDCGDQPGDAVRCDGDNGYEFDIEQTADDSEDVYLGTEPPVDGATIDYWKTDPDDVVVDHEGTNSTDSSGESSTNVVVDGDDAVGHSFTLGASSGGDSDSIEIQVVSGGTGELRGQITDEDGEPIENTEVTISGDGIDETVDTDADGEYGPIELGVGTYEDVVASAGEDGESAPKTFEIENNDETVQDFTLSEQDGDTGTIEGTVTDAGADEDDEIEGATVTVDTGHSVLTDENGEYRVEGVPAGERDVTAEADDYEERTETVSVEADTTATQDIELDGLPGSLDGRITDSDTGDAIEGATITIEGEDLDTESDSDGRYEFESVDRGTYDVTVDHPDYAPRTEEVTIGPNEDVTENFTLSDTEGSIFGVVRDDETNDPLEDVGITITEADGDTVVETATTDADGEYDVAVPGGEEYDVEADGSDLGFTVAEATDVSVGLDEDVRQDFDLAPVSVHVAGVGYEDDNNPDLYSDFDVESDDTTTPYDLAIDYQGNDWDSTRVTIDETDYTLTESAAQAIVDGEERDLLLAENYEDVDQDELDQYREIVTEDSTAVNVDDDLEVRIGP